jgi:hypothetical protein
MRDLRLVGEEDPGLGEEPVPLQGVDVRVVVDVRGDHAVAHIVDELREIGQRADAFLCRGRDLYIEEIYSVE